MSLKKLLDKILVEGANTHLLEALQALADGEKKEAERQVASFLVAHKALDGPLNWISHEEYIHAEDVHVGAGKVTGKVHYRNETYEVEVEV